jgi:hypothetical protein
MSGWVYFTAWLVGWLLAVRPSLRREMLRVVCSGCSHRRCDGSYCNCPCARRPRKPLGAVRERTGGDVAMAVWIAVWWPAWLWWVCTRITFRAIGLGVKTAVLRAVPLTAPELERRIAERDAEIKRLTKQIEGTP